MDLAWGIRGSEAYWRLVEREGTLAPGRPFKDSLTSSDAVWDDGSRCDVWTVTAERWGSPTFAIVTRNRDARHQAAEDQ